MFVIVPDFPKTYSLNSGQLGKNQCVGSKTAAAGQKMAKLAQMHHNPLNYSRQLYTLCSQLCQVEVTAND